MRHSRRTTRLGFTLIELIFVSSMMATVLGGVAMVIRTSQLAWSAHEADSSRIQSAHATLRHLVRRVRQATLVDSITSNSLILNMPDGSKNAWAHDSASTPKVVKFGVTIATDVLAENITNITFTGYQRDGTTTTTVVSEIHSIQCTVSVQLPRSPPLTKSVTCRAWLRSW